MTETIHPSIQFLQYDFQYIDVTHISSMMVLEILEYIMRVVHMYICLN